MMEASYVCDPRLSLRKDMEELVKQSGIRLEIRLQGLPLGRLNAFPFPLVGITGTSARTYPLFVHNRI